MRPATPQWRTIGGSLGFPDSDLEIIQHSPSLFPEGPPGYFREMLSQWLKWAPPKHPWPTLKALSVALQSSGHECLAVNLASCYVQRKGMWIGMSFRQLVACCLLNLESLKRFTVMLLDLFSADCQKVTHQHTACKLFFLIIGASLSEPHTSMTALVEVVCMYVCLRPYTINFKWAHLNILWRPFVYAICPARS